jgi:hypothetical protein
LPLLFLLNEKAAVGCSKKNVEEVGEQPRTTLGMFFSPIFRVFYLRPAPRELAYMVIFIDSQEVFLFVFGIYLLFLYIKYKSVPFS